MSVVRQVILGVRIFVLCGSALLCLVPPSQELWGQSGDRPLAAELKQRGAADGLALVGVARLMEVMRFDRGPETIQNPRGESRAWLSGNGEFVAWNILSRPVALDMSPSPIVVDALDGTQLWQVPGCVIGISSMGVSRDGRRIAFQAAYVPQGAPDPVRGLISNYVRIAGGVYYAESGATEVREILRFPSREPGNSQVKRGALSISWSPSGDAFSYDDQDRIYIYDIASRSQRSIASGSAPAWSPDGQWIAFRSIEGRAMAIRPETLETKVLLKGLKVESGVTWSPDSRYVLAFKRRSLAWDVFHGDLLDPNLPIADVVYRLEDRAKFVFESNTDQWVRDYRTFLEGASVPPVVKNCE